MCAQTSSSFGTLKIEKNIEGEKSSIKINLNNPALRDGQNDVLDGLKNVKIGEVTKRLEKLVNMTMKRSAPHVRRVRRYLETKAGIQFENSSEDSSDSYVGEDGDAAALLVRFQIWEKRKAKSKRFRLEREKVRSRPTHQWLCDVKA